MRIPVLALIVASLSIAYAPPIRAQVIDQWDVWVDQNHCADTRAGWLAVAKENPGFGWSKMPGAPTSELLSEAIANMDAMRISGPFQNHCCKFVVWRQSNPDALTLVRENDVAGAGWMPDSTPMCGETAILQFGMDDVLGALTLPLGSVPGVTVTVTANGIVSGTTAAVSIPTNPPTVVSASPGGNGTLPEGVVARVEGTFTLTCERVDMASSSYQGAMILDFADAGGTIGQGTMTLVGGEFGQLDFSLQTQLIATQLGALGVLENPGQGVGRIEVTVMGLLNGAPEGVASASGEIKASIGMKARFANGRTPGDGSCTGRLAT